MPASSKYNTLIRSKSAVSTKPKMMQNTDDQTFQMSRTQELNENNFIKKLKTLSKTSVDITVKSLRPPKIKTDIQSVDPLRMLAKSASQVPATRYERTDQLNFIKSRDNVRNYENDLQDEQAKNAHQEYDANKVKWNHNFIQDQISGINDTIHHTGLTAARTNTMKMVDVTNGIADL